MEIETIDITKTANCFRGIYKSLWAAGILAALGIYIIFRLMYIAGASISVYDLCIPMALIFVALIATAGWVRARKGHKSGIYLIATAFILHLAFTIFLGICLFYIDWSSASQNGTLIILQTALLGLIFLGIAFTSAVALKPAIKRMGQQRHILPEHYCQSHFRGHKIPWQWPDKRSSCILVIILLLITGTVGAVAVIFTILAFSLLNHLFFVGAALFWWVYTKTRSAAFRRLAVPAEKALSTDHRQPILMLRSFVDDSLQMPKSFLTVKTPLTFEEVLATELWRIGPVTAIGRPGEPLPEIGAARDYVIGEQWKKRVSERVAQAQLMILIVGGTEGLAWEIAHLITQKTLSKAILAFPPISTKSNSDIWVERWDAFQFSLQVNLKGANEAEILLSLPLSTKHGMETLFLIFPEPNRCVQIIAKRMLPIYYSNALRLAHYLLKVPSPS